jgi:ABC-type arginine/histidine transport system permease subunit
MPELVNWSLLKEPMNWIIVALMLAIAAFGLHLVMGDGAGFQHATGSAGQ